MTSVPRATIGEKTNLGAAAHVAILSPLMRHAGKAHGGIEPVVTNLAKYFGTRGIRADLLVFSRSQPLHDFGADHPLVRILPVGMAPKFITAARLARYLKRDKPVVLISAGWRANTVASWTKRIPGISTPVWAGLHNTISIREETRTLIARWWRRSIIRAHYKRFDGIIAVSRGVAADFVRYTGISAKDVHVIYNPVVTEEILTNARQPVEHPWFLSDGPPIILGAGRLCQQKDFQTLIRAFRSVLRNRPCRLVILGEGDTRQNLEQLAQDLGLQDYVAFPGFVENPFAYMKRAALFVLSSAFEGLPNVLIEALACGCRVVSTDCPSGPREILDHGGYGLLVPVGDPEALAKAIEDTLNKPLDQQILKAASERFRVETSGEAYIRLLGLEARG